MTTDRQPVEPPIARPRPPAPAPAPVSPFGERLRELERVTGASTKLASDVRDVHAVLDAQDREARGDLAGAVKAWFEALESAPTSRFGERALHGWLKAYTKKLGKRSDPVVLARLIMAETLEGQASPYMRDHGLTNDAAITPVLVKVVPEALSSDGGSAAAVAGGIQMEGPPAARGVPDDDPLLIRAAARGCAASQANLAAWHAWIQSLDEPVRQYWRALVAQGCGDVQAAMRDFAAAAPLLAKEAPTQGLAVEAAGRLAALQRANDKRTEAADTYNELMQLWTKPGVTAEAMGVDDVSLKLRRIDETLWASRYRALVGDYENGKIYAQRALDMAAAFAKAHRHGLKQAARDQLASLRAEAYHALAFRIAVERGEFDSAYSLMVMALQTPDLSREWQEKLIWSAGLYEYLAGHYEGARARWEALLERSRDDALRPALRFWLAKTMIKLGKRTAADAQLDELAAEYPLSFYAAVAPTAAGLKGMHDWREIFGDPAPLAQRLLSAHDWSLGKLRRSPEIGPRLSRAEILAVADQGELARLAVDDLEAAMGPELLLETNTQAFVYLTRLQYAVGSYLKAIGMTTRLAHAIPNFWKKYPEQLLVYFPRPYSPVFDKNADLNHLDPELLLGIARQESGFTPEARSNVNAVGLMQLIHPTARRFAAELGMPTDHIDETLRDPESNIRVGSRYLRFLSLTFNSFPPAVYGGYNAGEFAVQLWLKRRAHADPMMFIELVPFAETKDYIKNVWRNVVVYKYLRSAPPPVGKPGLDLTPAAAH